MEVEYRYQEYGEVYLFFLRPIIEHVIPDNQREKYKSRLITRLKEYQFTKRSKKDPAHPNSVEVRGNIEIIFKNIFNPEETAEAIITSLHGYYLAPTQNRIKRYIENNL